MMRLFVVLFRPAAAAAYFRSRSAWFAPFAIIVAARMALVVAMHRWVTAATVMRLPPGADDVDRVIAAGQLDRELVPQLMFFPVRSFLGYAAVAALAALLIKLWRPPRPLLFGQILALFIAAEGTLLVGEVVRAAGILSGMSAGFLIPFGLDRLVVGWVRPSVLPLFNVVNLFAVWYVSSLALSLSALSGLARITAAAIAVQVWGAVAFFQLIVMTVVSVAMHMPV